MQTEREKEREMIVAATRGSCRLVCLTGHFVLWPGLNKGWREKNRHHDKKHTELEGTRLVTQFKKRYQLRLENLKGYSKYKSVKRSQIYT